MNKTISVNLSGQNFIMEEDAYRELQNYLDEIKKHCGVDTDITEVMADIESGIAEKLKSSLTSYKEVVTIGDIRSLIKVMGTTEDFDREVGETSGELSGEDGKNNKTKRRLYRDMDSSIIGGVAAGLGNYFDIDPVIFRILFFALIFANGFGILLYIILWIAMPEAKTVNQKLEMRGQAPTIAAFEKMSKIGRDFKGDWKERWNKFSALGKIFSLPFLAINYLLSVAKTVVSKVWPVLKYIFGAALIILSLLGLAAIGIGSLYLLLQTHSPYRFSFVPITELISTVPFIALVVSGFFSLAIPILLLLCGGLAIIRKKNILTFSVAAILISAWMMAGISCCALGLRHLPDIWDKLENYPAVKNTTINIDISGVDRLVANGRINVEVVPGTSTTAILSGRLVDIQGIDIKKENTDLNLSEMDIEESLCLECYHRSVRLIISGDELSEIKAEDGAIINIQKDVKSTPILTADDHAKINWQGIDVPALTATSKDNSVINISGTASSAKLVVESGEIKLSNFIGRAVDVALGGNNSTVRLSGKIDNLSVVNRSIEEANILNASGLKVKKITIDSIGDAEIIMGEVGEIRSSQAANVKLFYTGKTKLTGDLKDYKIVTYQETDRTKFEEGENGIDQDLNDLVQKGDIEFVDMYDIFYILDRGDLSNSDFQDLIRIFRNEQRNLF